MNTIGRIFIAAMNDSREVLSRHTCHYGLKIKRTVVSLAMCIVMASHYAVAQEDSAQSLYVELEKPLIVNILTSESIHFLRITVQLKLTDPVYAPQIRYHMAPIKHSLIQTLSEKPYFEFQTVAGKRKIRSDALAAVRQAVKENIGESAVDNIFFTSLIVQ